MYPVAEHFVSINGESTRAGELAVFIRFRGCNLRCSYCDTMWANSVSAAAEMMTADQIADIVKSSGVKNVTLTGGEPLMQNNIQELTDKLISQGSRVEIETNGSVSLQTLADAEYRPVFTMDYKLPSSGMEQFMDENNFRYLKEQDTVKFVSGNYEDLEKAKYIIDKHDLLSKCHVYLSPVFGKIEPADMVDFMIKNNMNSVRLQLQLHKFIWDPEKRGV